MVYRLFRTNSRRDGMEPVFQHAGGVARPVDESGCEQASQAGRGQVDDAGVHCGRAQHFRRHPAHHRGRSNQRQTGEIIGIAAGQWRGIGNQRERGVRRDGPASHQRGESVARHRLRIQPRARRNAGAYPRRLGGRMHRFLGAVCIPDCRVDERRSGFDFVTAFRRFRIPYGNFRHFRRSGADSDSR